MKHHSLKKVFFALCLACGMALPGVASGGEHDDFEARWAAAEAMLSENLARRIAADERTHYRSADDLVEELIADQPELAPKRVRLRDIVRSGTDRMFELIAEKAAILFAERMSLAEIEDLRRFSEAPIFARLMLMASDRERYGQLLLQAREVYAALDANLVPMDAVLDLVRVLEETIGPALRAEGVDYPDLFGGYPASSEAPAEAGDPQ